MVSCDLARTMSRKDARGWNGVDTPMLIDRTGGSLLWLSDRGTQDHVYGQRRPAHAHAVARHRKGTGRRRLSPGGKPSTSSSCCSASALPAPSAEFLPASPHGMPGRSGAV